MSLRAFGRLARAARHKLCVPTLAALQHASLPDAACGPSVSRSDSPAFFFHNHFRVDKYGVAAQTMAQELETYRISVITGNVRGAGTPSMAWVQLMGTAGESEKYEVGNSSEEGLMRGSKVTFEVQVPRDIGALRRVLIQRDKGSYSDSGDGWYLDAIEVDGPHGAHYHFPCHAWFGQSDCGGFAGVRAAAAGCACSARCMRHDAAPGIAGPHREGMPAMPLRCMQCAGDAQTLGNSSDGAGHAPCSAGVLAACPAHCQWTGGCSYGCPPRTARLS